MTIDDTRLVKDMLIACEGIDDLEDCMVAALHVVKEAYEQAKKPDSANTALVKKLVDALNDSEQLLQDAQDIMRSNIIHNGISNKDAIAAYIALLDNVRQRRVQTQTHEALTEAQAYLERQEGKASELVDDSPMYPDTEEYSQFNLWAATQGGNIDQCNYEAWKSGYRCAARLERQGKCGEGA